MAKKHKETILVISLLILGAVPIIAGIVRALRIVQLDGSPDNARFLENQTSALIHIFSLILYAGLGPFQFSTILRTRWPSIHKSIGLILVASGLGVALSGLWMTYYY